MTEGAVLGSAGWLACCVAVGAAPACSDDAAPADADGTAGPTSDATDTDATASESGAGTQTEGTGSCQSVEIDISPFEPVIQANVGELEPHDMDADGLVDLVGELGWILFQDASGGLEAHELPAFSGLVARPGEFGGDEAPDLVAKASDELGLQVYLGGGLDGDPPISTLTSAVSSYRVRDCNADGTEDLAVLLQDLETVELWLGTTQGEFESGQQFSAGGLIADLTFAATSGSHADLVVAKQDALQLFAGDGTGSFGAAEPIEQPFTWFVRGVPRPTSGTDQLLVSYAFSQLEEQHGAGFLFRDGSQWAGENYPLSRRPVTMDAIDLTDDGLMEIVLAFAQATNDIEFACGPSAPELRPCGSAELAGPPTGLGVIPSSAGQHRIAYTTASAGTWVASLTVSCR